MNNVGDQLRDMLVNGLRVLDDRIMDQIIWERHRDQLEMQIWDHLLDQLGSQLYAPIQEHLDQKMKR